MTRLGKISRGYTWLAKRKNNNIIIMMLGLWGFCMFGFFFFFKFPVLLWNCSGVALMLQITYYFICPFLGSFLQQFFLPTVCSKRLWRSETVDQKGEWHSMQNITYRLNLESHLFCFVHDKYKKDIMKDIGNQTKLEATDFLYMDKITWDISQSYYMSIIIYCVPLFLAHKIVESG